MPLGVFCGLGQMVFILAIASLTNSFRVALKEKSVIGMDVVSVWFMWPIVGLVSERG